MRASLLVTLFLAGCTGDLTVDLDGDAPDGATPPADSGPRMDAPRTDAGPDASDPPPMFDAGPCSMGLADNFSITPIMGLPSARGAHAAASNTGGLAIAWPSGDGVLLTLVDGAARTLGAESVIPGIAPWGVAVSADDTVGVLVERGSDEMWLVGVSADGSTRFETRLLGGVSHDVTENEWFGTGIRAGRLAWTGSRWAAYVTVQRLWSDGVAHYGDTLRYLDAGGTAESGGWGWGCSHSMQVGITHNGTGIGPVCVSDCFPDKGVFFAHRTELFNDPSGNCGGRIDTRLGGIAALSDGFLVAFATPHMRSSADVALIHVANDRTASPTEWLTSDGAVDADVHIGPYGDGALVGWNGGGTDRLAAVDRTGSPILGPEDGAAAGLGDASDFVRLSDGDAAWVTPMGSGLAMARVRACF